MKKKKPSIKLPNKLSDLILLAVKDAKWVEKQPDKFTFDMSGTWLARPPNEPCQVCMAGSVIAHRAAKESHKTHPGDEYPGSFPHAFDANTAKALLAVDQFRLGHLSQAALIMRVKTSPAQRELLAIIGSAMRNQTLVNGAYDWEVYIRTAKQIKAIGL